MATAFKWTTPESISSILTTGLNSLSDGAYCSAGSAIDNVTDLYLWAVAELTVTFGSTPSSGGYCSLFLLPSLDDTNYADGGGAVVPSPGLLVADFPLLATTNAQRVITPAFPIPPFKFKPVLLNASGQAFPSSGSIVKMRRFNEQGV